MSKNGQRRKEMPIKRRKENFQKRAESVESRSMKKKEKQHLLKLKTIDIKKMEGKNVKIKNKVGGGIFSGKLHISSDDIIVLSNLTIHHQSGGETISKSKEKRKFKIKNIKII